MLLMLCATLGAAVGRLSPQTRPARAALLTAGLGAGQGLGHVALALTSGHHHTAGLSTAPMLALHAAAAVGLGLVVGAAEYLYVVCASVLCWLRIFPGGRSPARRPQPVVAHRCRGGASGAAARRSGNAGAARGVHCGRLASAIATCEPVVRWRAVTRCAATCAHIPLSEGIPHDHHP